VYVPHRTLAKIFTANMLLIWTILVQYIRNIGGNIRKFGVTAGSKGQEQFRRPLCLSRENVTAPPFPSLSSSIEHRSQISMSDLAPPTDSGDQSGLSFGATDCSGCRSRAEPDLGINIYLG
jgi:hypothetical protein